MNYINNWRYQLAGIFSPGQAALPIPAVALDRLALVEGVEYVLTLAANLNPETADETEIIRVAGSASGYTVQRGQEGTQEQAWPQGTHIYCDVTAGALNNLIAQVSALTARVEALESGGGGLPDNVLIDSTGNTLIDNTGNYLIYGA